MADDSNPFLAALAQATPQDSTQVPLDPQQQSVPAVPDVSNLPVNSGPVPQAPAPKPQAPQSSGYQGPRPILLDLVQGLAGKLTDPSTGRPVSRAATMEDFLGNFVSALGAGFAAAGHGPGAAARGAGAAIGAPLQQQQQRAQFAQQQQMGQAQIEAEQASTAQRQKQTELSGSMVTIQTPSGPMSLPYNVALQSGLLKGALAAQSGAQAKITTEQLRQQASQGNVARVEDYKDPNTGQIIGRMSYNKQGQQLGLLQGAIDPKTLPTVNTSQQWLETSPGTWELVNKTSTSRKGGAPSGFPQSTAPSAARHRTRLHRLPRVRINRPLARTSNSLRTRCLPWAVVARPSRGTSRFMPLTRILNRR
jgi:hypothetical protein